MTFTSSHALHAGNLLGYGLPEDVLSSSSFRIQAAAGYYHSSLEISVGGASPHDILVLSPRALPFILPTYVGLVESESFGRNQIRLGVWQKLRWLCSCGELCGGPLNGSQHPVEPARRAWSRWFYEWKIWMAFPISLAAHFSSLSYETSHCSTPDSNIR